MLHEFSHIQANLNAKDITRNNIKIGGVSMNKEK